MISFSAFRAYRNNKKNIQLRLYSEKQKRALAEANLLQKTILENAPVVIWLVGVDGHFRFINRTFRDAVGIAESEFLNTTDISGLLGEEVAANFLSSDQQCLNRDEPYLSHELMKFVDGEQHRIEITRAKVKNVTGEVIGIIGIGVDMTKRHETENKLRKLLQVIEQASESVMITDIHGTIEYVNPAFTTITGYKPEEVLGENPRILKSGNQTTEYYQRLWATISSGESWNSAVIDRRKDGSQYPALMTISPILNHDGKITHYVGTQQDMSSHDMLEEKLRQAQKMEALGTLVGGIAHDFNNMLAGITGNIYLAREKIYDMPDVIRMLDAVDGLSFRAAKMIKQLLVFARKDRICMKPFGLVSFIKEISRISEATIPENIYFHCELSDKEMVVKGDATQLQQVLMNLLNNARDAVSGVSEPEIYFKADRFAADESFLAKFPELEGGIYAHLLVHDNGCGISDQDKEHIFEPFFTTKEVGHGTGLGLSMAYGAINSHHGVMEVDSLPGKETTFHIYLPLIEEQNIAVEHHDLHVVQPGHGEVILIVDDNSDIRNTCKDVLENMGYSVLLASDGLEAVDYFASGDSDIALILMDVVMPRLGGVKAFARIEKLCPGIKVIFTTGYDKDETLKNEMPSEGSTILTKPYSIAILSQTVRDALDSQGDDALGQ